MKLKYALLGLVAPFFMDAQNVMTPETLWSLKKVGVQVNSPQDSHLIYKVTQTDIKTEKNNSETYMLNAAKGMVSKVDFGKKTPLQWDGNGLYALEGGKIFISKDSGKTWNEFYSVGDVDNIVISPDAKKVAFSKEVLVEKVLATEKYQDTPESTGHIYHDLNHRHWDYFNQGKYNHVFVVEVSKNVDEAKDLLEGKKWDSPQRPFGGAEDFIWSPDSTKLLYVTKAVEGKDYATSTNTDIFAYDLNSGETKNLTELNKGYDMAPIFSPDGRYLAWLSMERDGYEADKNDIKILDWKTGKVTNLTKDWDETVTGNFQWNWDSKSLYFVAAFRGTQHLFSVDIKNKKVQQLTKGEFDINSIAAVNKSEVVVTKVDINHSAELYKVDPKTAKLTPLTDVNKETYAQIKTGKSELKMIKTTDGK